MQLPIARNRRAQPVQDSSSRSGILWILRDACCESNGCHVHDQFTSQTTSPFTVLADRARHHTAHCTRAAVASSKLATDSPLLYEVVRPIRCSRKTDYTGIRSSRCRQSARAPKEGGRPWTGLLGLLSTGCRFSKTRRKTSHSAHGGESIVCWLVRVSLVPVQLFIASYASNKPASMCFRQEVEEIVPML